MHLKLTLALNQVVHGLLDALNAYRDILESTPDGNVLAVQDLETGFHIRLAPLLPCWIANVLERHLWVFACAMQENTV